MLADGTLMRAAAPLFIATGSFGMEYTGRLTIGRRTRETPNA
jgi:hypothetical protein